MTQTNDRPRPGWLRFGPDLSMRVSDADRAMVADRLARHFSDGRLDQAEFDDRVSRAMAAKTVGDFQGLFDDLPDLADLPGGTRDDTADDTSSGFAGIPGTWPPTACHAARHRHGLLRGPVRALLAVVLVLVVADIAWHAMLGWLSPLVWLAVIVAVIVLVSRRARRSS
ncbi:MAG TPA: DUF1707 domain-containing protein [Trebonia sp.]|nr:DUF1707 domain-containing protein [Trebonia sp.]